MYHLLSNVTSDFKYLSKTKIASIYTQEGKKVSLKKYLMSYLHHLTHTVTSLNDSSLTKQTKSYI